MTALLALLETLADALDDALDDAAEDRDIYKDAITTALDHIDDAQRFNWPDRFTLAVRTLEQSL